MYYKKFFYSGITHIHDLRLDLNINVPSVMFQIKLEKLAFYNGQVFDTQYLIFWKMIMIISIH